MHRLQISLTETHYEFLKSEAFVTGQSMAALLRDLLDEVIRARQQELLTSDPIWEVIGVGQEVEGPTDISRNIDKYLYGPPAAPAESPQLAQVAETPHEHVAD